LKSILAPQIGATAISSTFSKTTLPTTEIRDVYMSNVLQANSSQTPARQAMLLAGLPSSVEAVTVNKVCASGVKAVRLAAHKIQLGLADAQVAGGMESMSRMPHYVSHAAQNPAFGDVARQNGLIKDGL
jgi:acetyl-CoA C-acetyltransferase